MTDTRDQLGINYATEAALLANVDTQVILQLLVSKGIFTREEVTSTRELVKRHTEFGQMLKTLESQRKDLEEGYEFEKVLDKVLRNRGEATDAERDFLTKALEKGGGTP